MSKFLFNRDFQLNILSLLYQDKDFLSLCTDIVKPSYFTDDILSWFFIKLRDYHIDYEGSDLSTNYFYNEINKIKEEDKRKNRLDKEKLLRYLEVVDNLETYVPEKEYVIEEVVEFCKTQELRQFFLKSAENLNTDRRDKFDIISNEFQKALSTGDQYLNLGSKYFSTYQDRVNGRLDEEETPLYPVGVSLLDIEYLNGGMRPGQLLLWLGASGRGKSIALNQAARANLIFGRKVVHYTCELSEAETAERYDASFTGVNVSDLKIEYTSVLDKMSKRFRRIGDNLIIKEFESGQATVDTLKAHFNQLKKSGFHPDVVIVDYLDLLKPNSNYKSMYEELKSITTQLKGMAQKYKVAIFTASQVNREAYGRDSIKEANLSGSMEKLFIADVVLSINMNEDERSSNKARIGVLKNRNGKVGAELDIYTDYATMRFSRPVDESS